MKIYLMGRGHRLEQIRDALGLSRLSAQLVDKERDTIKFGAPFNPISPEDLIIVTDFEEPTLRLTLDNLVRQELPAKVMVISADRVTQADTGESWFVATVEVDAAGLKDYPQIRLRAGMPAEVFVTTPARTLFEYLLKPLSQFSSRAMREP